MLGGETVEYIPECSYTLMSSDNANVGELGNAKKFAIFKKKDAVTDVQEWYSARIENKK